MKHEKPINTAASNRLLSIVKTISGADPCSKARYTENLNARMVVYKILRDYEFWTFASMGSLFGLDHATARHGYRNFENFRSQDEQLENLFQKVFEIYSSEKAVIDELDLNNLQIEVTEKDVKIEQLNFEVFRLNKEIDKLKNEKREYADILNILRMKVPNNKKEIAARKINTVLNSI